MKKKLEALQDNTPVYAKGSVKITGLLSQLTTYPDGSVCVDVYKLPEANKKDSYYYYRPTAKDKVIRIFVSENTRITNNVLRTLVNK